MRSALLRVSHRRAKRLKIVRTILELDLDRPKAVALVPTMGAFHEGHLSLMRRAKDVADTVIVSLFVNPMQFVKGEDFEHYPRNEEHDFHLAESVGVDIMFAPSVEEMYRGEQTIVQIQGVTSRWEGEHRPGHFEGVATIVAKLFNIIRPDIAIFGLKDFQQCVVIDRVVKDLNFPVALMFEETVREPDGLAMSSRNAYLSAQERGIAPLLHRELVRLAGLAAPINAEFQASKRALSDAGFVVDYLALVDGRSLEPTKEARKGN